MSSGDRDMGGVGSGKRRGRHDVNTILTKEILKHFQIKKKPTGIVRKIINFKDIFLEENSF